MEYIYTLECGVCHKIQEDRLTDGSRCALIKVCVRLPYDVSRHVSTATNKPSPWQKMSIVTIISVIRPNGWETATNVCFTDLVTFKLQDKAAKLRNENSYNFHKYASSFTVGLQLALLVLKLSVGLTRRTLHLQTGLKGFQRTEREACLHHVCHPTLLKNFLFLSILIFLLYHSWSMLLPPFPPRVLLHLILFHSSASFLTVYHLWETFHMLSSSRFGTSLVYPFSLIFYF